MPEWTDTINALAPAVDVEAAVERFTFARSRRRRRRRYLRGAAGAMVAVMAAGLAFVSLDGDDARTVETATSAVERAGDPSNGPSLEADRIELNPNEVRIVFAVPDPTQGASAALLAATDLPTAQALVETVTARVGLAPFRYDLRSEVLVAINVSSAACALVFNGMESGRGRTLTASFGAATSAPTHDCSDLPGWTTYLLALPRAAMAPWFVLASSAGTVSGEPAPTLRVEVAAGPASASAATIVSTTATSGAVPPLDTTMAPGASTSDSEDTGLDGPPPITVFGSSGALDAAIPSACWNTGRFTGCYEGSLTFVPHAGAVARPIRFAFPFDGWTFAAIMGPSDGISGGPAQIWPTGNRTWEIALTGRAGQSKVRLFGRGPQGEVQATFTVELLVAGIEPAPTALLRGPYPAENVPKGTAVWLIALVATGLAVDTDPAATVRTTYANGASTQVELGQHPDVSDPNGDGRISLHSTQADAQALLAVGPGPYTFEVTLTIAGRTYRGTAHYPQDYDTTPHAMFPAQRGMALTFEPPLPAR